MPVFEQELAFQTIPEQDVSRQMRGGHPQIAEGDDYIESLLRQHAQRLGRKLVVLVVGCGTGYFANRLAATFPEMDVVAQEDHPVVVGRLRQRHAGTRVRVFTESLDRWAEPVDVVLGWGSHHHLPRSYLDHARRILKPDGVFILGDEFCPEYCTGALKERIERAELLHMASGYVLTSEAEVRAFRERGEVPQPAREMERLRQKRLWAWYRYVIDLAMARDCLGVVLYELRAARDDLETNHGDEHKMSPLITEREVALHGFSQRSRHFVGHETDPGQQSFFIYELVPRAA